VLWFGRHHKAAHLALYSGAKIKAEETPTINGYSGWLRRLVNEEIDAKGVETAKGVKAEKARETRAANLAVAKVANVVEIDYMKDMEALADAEKRRALEVLKVNLLADIAELDRKMAKTKAGREAIKTAVTAVATARRKAIA